MESDEEHPEPGQQLDGPLEPGPLPDDLDEEPEQAVIPVSSLGELEPQAPPATPTTTARWLAFAAIIIGGACGGLIGYGFTDLQCDDGCSTAAAFGGLVGAVLGAGGLAIVAVLGLRAIAEWESIQDAEAHQTHPSRKRPS